MANRSFKEQLRELVIETARQGEDISEELTEIESYCEDRCKEEFLKIEAFQQMAIGIKEALDAGHDPEELQTIPIVKAELNATDMALSGALKPTLH